MDAAPHRATYAEYLEAEAASDVRHEFVAGVIVAMAGGSVEHGRLIGRLSGLLTRALDGRPCVVLPSDVRVRIRAADRATYPDLHVVCREVERDPDDRDAVVNPTMIVEVLSDTTAEGDRGDKFADYRRLRSLREYVLVSQRERRIDVYRRDGRRWHLDEYGSGERVVFEALGVDVAVDDIYVDGLGTIVEPRAAND
jgi:Uma2 family endonuclease